ncbi:zinc ribbon domain-containing protein [Pradoshia sp.]
MWFEINLAKIITKVSWAEYRRMLEYKDEWYDKRVIVVEQKCTSQCERI